MKRTNAVKFLIIAFGLGLLGLIIWAVWEGIDQQHLHEGKVIRRNFSPGHVSTYSERHYDDKGKLVAVVPITTYIPPIWTVVIEGVRDDGKIGRRNVIVTEQEYNQIKIGQHFIADAINGDNDIEAKGQP